MENEKPKVEGADPKLVEVLASVICQACGDLPVLEPDAEGEVFRAAWQDSMDLRGKWRETAREVIAWLEENGVRLRTSDVRKQEKCLDWLRTIPPRLAYDDSELAQ